MALRQGKYSALGKALGQYRTSLYDVMEKEHDKEFLSWKGERDRANLAGGIAAAAQGIDMLQKMRSKKQRAEETKAYLIAEGGAESIERKTKHGGFLGKMQMGIEDLFGGEATYDVEGGDIGDGTFGAGKLRGMAQFHAVESMMNPEQAAKDKERYEMKRKGEATYDEALKDNPFLKETGGGEEKYPWVESDLAQGMATIESEEAGLAEESRKASFQESFGVKGKGGSYEDVTQVPTEDDFGMRSSFGDIFNSNEFLPNRRGDRGYGQYSLAQLRKKTGQRDND